MIRVRRGPEPPELAKQRHRRLARLALAWRRLGIDMNDASALVEFVRAHESELERGHGSAREVLRDRLRKKCSYCERSVSKADPLDHYRPRRSCVGEDGTIEHGGYWWLAWSWNNLLLSCTEHNSIKGSKFDVDGPRLTPLTWESANEQPRLLDPAVVDPLEHLELFEGSDGHWTVQGKTRLGASTAEALELDRPSDRYDQRLRILESLVTDLRERATSGSHALRELWRRKIPVVLDEDAEFRMLAWAYLVKRIADLICEHGLELPSLYDAAPAEEAEPLFPVRPALEGLGEALTLRILALGSKPRAEATRAVIIELVSLRAWSLDALLEVLPQSVETIRKHLRALETSGDVEFDGVQIYRVGPCA